MRMTAERFRTFRKEYWPWIRGYVEERIERHRMLLEVPADRRRTQTDDTDDMLRGRNAELRILIDAIENDEMLLAELEEPKEKEGEE